MLEYGRKMKDGQSAPEASEEEPAHAQEEDGSVDLREPSENNFKRLLGIEEEEPEPQQEAASAEEACTESDEAIHELEEAMKGSEEAY